MQILLYFLFPVFLIALGGFSGYLLYRIRVGYRKKYKTSPTDNPYFLRTEELIIRYNYLTYGALIGAALWGVLIALSFILVPFELQEYETTEIVAIQGNENTEGSFFLGSGSVNSYMYYYYMEDTEKGKRMDKTPAEETYLEEGSGQPKLVTYKVERQSGYKWIDYILPKSDSIKEYRFYVPEDTVKENYNVDLK